MSLPTGEGAGKKVSTDEEAKRKHGKTVERALELAGLTPQDVQHSFNYANQTPISKWTTGLENPPIHRLLELPRFAPAYIVAIAERNGVHIDMATVLTIRRLA